MLDCDVGGTFDAIQIVQPGEVCDNNVTDVFWPSYMDWELDADGDTTFPSGDFGNEPLFSHNQI